MAKYSLADLARITGSKPRSIQLWAEGGALVTDEEIHGGRGTYRRYSEKEATIATIVARFANRQIAIGELARIAEAARCIPCIETKEGQLSFKWQGETITAKWHEPSDFSGDGLTAVFYHQPHWLAASI